MPGRRHVHEYTVSLLLELEGFGMPRQGNITRRLSRVDIQHAERTFTVPDQGLAPRSVVPNVVRIAEFLDALYRDKRSAVAAVNTAAAAVCHVHAVFLGQVN